MIKLMNIRDKGREGDRERERAKKNNSKVNKFRTSKICMLLLFHFIFLPLHTFLPVSPKVVKET